MKSYIYILIFVLGLFSVSCNEQTPYSDTNVGYLSIDKINLSCDKEMIPLTRAVDVGLKLEIYRGTEKVRSYEAGAAELSKRIVLGIGEYTLKAFTPDREEAADNVVGSPIYSVEYAFSITSEEITEIAVTVPQVNVGVSADFSEDIKMNFSDYYLVVYSSTGREAKIGKDDQGIYYFNIPEGNVLHYKLIAINQDGEQMTSEERIIPQKEEALKAGNYRIVVGF